MSKEWCNSLYRFDKSSYRTLPVLYDHTFKLLKWHFNMINDWMQEKVSSNRIHNYSGHKIWIGNPEIKHFNDKINITIYVYDNAYNFYKKKLELFEFTWGPILTTEQNLSNEDNDKFRLLKREFPSYIGTNKIINLKISSFYQNMIRWLKLDKYTQMSSYRLNLLNFINKDNENTFDFLSNLKIQNYDYLINQYSKQLLYLKYKQKMLSHEFKYNEISLSTTIRFIQNLYNKKIELNIITLKYFWLSSSILLQILTAKIKNPNNRGKYLFPLNYAMDKIKVPILSRHQFSGEIKPYVGIQNVRLNLFNYNQKDYLNEFILSNNVKSKVWSENNIDGLVLSNLENKVVAGVFLKIAGRLTKRYKAQRAVQKLAFKGTLKNVYSAHRNYSSSLSKGYSNINIEKAAISSNVRIGAFGLTGWIASY